MALRLSQGFVAGKRLLTNSLRHIQQLPNMLFFVHHQESLNPTHQESVQYLISSQTNPETHTSKAFTFSHGIKSSHLRIPKLL